MVRFLIKYPFKACRKFVIRSSFLMPVIKNHFPLFFTHTEAFNLSFEDATFKALKLLSSNEKKSIDIGVLWGEHAVKMIAHSHSLHCFEPNIVCFKHLKRIFDSHKCANKVTLHNVALSNSRGRTAMRIPRKSLANATIEKSNNLNTFSDVFTKEIEIAKLDDFDINNVGFIKIDVEGHEYNVLLGAKETIQANRATLLVEVEERHNRGSVSKVINFIHSLDYKVFFIDNKRILSFKHYSIKKHQNVDLIGTTGYINNFIFIHDIKVKRIKKKFKRNGYDTSNM